MIVDSIFAGPVGTVESVSSLLYSAGFFLFGIAIWRSGVLPGWAGVLIAVHAPLITGPVPLVGSVPREHSWRSWEEDGSPSVFCGTPLVERNPGRRQVPGERVPERSRRPCHSVDVTLHDRQYHQRQPW